MKNIAQFLANRIRNTKVGSFTYTITRIGMASIAIGISILILSYSVLFGFKKTIKEKLFSLNAHLQVSKISLNQSFDESPLQINDEIKDVFAKNERLDGIFTVTNKAAILKSETDIAGILIKGVDSSFVNNYFSENIIVGGNLDISSKSSENQILVSETLAKKLKIRVGESVLVYFIQNPPRARKVKVKGIFTTGIEEYDKQLIIGDNRLVHKMNNWSPGQIGHFEIFVKDMNQIEAVKEQLLADLPSFLSVVSIMDISPEYFDWFELLDRNILIIIVLILIVASFNMMSVLLIMIMERTQMIGLLKALGTANQTIRAMFFRNALFIVWKGLLWGNGIGLALCWIQDTFQVIQLDPVNYYMNFVPISWEWGWYIAVNAALFLVVSAIVFLTTSTILTIKPIAAIRTKK
ncbi:MAG: ABC transporter permease [Spirosomataceae bacterium]